MSNIPPIIYDPDKKTIKFNHFEFTNFYCGQVLSDEAVILLKLSTDFITLQEALNQLMALRLKLAHDVSNSIYLSKTLGEDL